MGLPFVFYKAELVLNPTSRASRSTHGYLADTATSGRKADYVALPGTTCSHNMQPKRLEL